jgi:hypothetical protein
MQVTLHFETRMFLLTPFQGYDISFTYLNMSRDGSEFDREFICDGQLLFLSNSLYSSVRLLIVSLLCFLLHSGY